jgi:hypothetical protein
MRRLLDVLSEGAPAPESPKRFDETNSDGLLRLVLESDGTRTVDINHFGAEAEDGIAHVEAAIKALYSQASKVASATTTTESE